MRVRLLLGQMPGSRLPVYLVEAPYLYKRGGSPYQDSQGEEWPDNLQRFALLGWVAAHLAAEEADPASTLALYRAALRIRRAPTSRSSPCTAPACGSTRRPAWCSPTGWACWVSRRT